MLSQVGTSILSAKSMCNYLNGVITQGRLPPLPTYLPKEVQSIRCLHRVYCNLYDKRITLTKAA